MRLTSEAVSGFLGVAHDQEWCADGVSIDTRELKSGSLFIAIGGKNIDSHDFLGEVKGKGAVAAIVERNVDVDLPQIVVESTISSLQNLASQYRRDFKGKVIGITGSLGKTTTREMIVWLLKKSCKVHRSCKNYNNHIGLPFSILNAPDDSDFMILEMGMSNAGELDLLTAIAKPDIVIVTNVDMVHIGNFNSVSDIAKAKSEIFKGINNGGIALLCSDCQFHRSLSLEARKYTNKVFTVGFAEGSDLKIVSFQQDLVDIELLGKIYRYRVGSLAAFNLLMSSSFALMIVTLLGIDPDSVLDLIAEFQPPQGRGLVIDTGFIKIIDDSYNASFVSICNALKVLDSMEGNRKLAIIGDIMELDKFTDEVHAKLLVPIKASKVDVLVLVGQYVKVLYNITQEEGLDIQVLWFENTDSLISSMGDIVVFGDVVLIKGSNGCKLGRVVSYLKEG